MCCEIVNNRSHHGNCKCALTPVRAAENTYDLRTWTWSRVAKTSKIKTQQDLPTNNEVNFEYSLFHVQCMDVAWRLWTVAISAVILGLKRNRD